MQNEKEKEKTENRILPPAENIKYSFILVYCDSVILFIQKNKLFYMPNILFVLSLLRLPLITILITQDIKTTLVT